MATAKQRKRRLDRRHKHQEKTDNILAHKAVQQGGVTHIFPHQKAAVDAFADAKAENERVSQAIKDLAHEVAETLEAKLPEGVVVGEDERKVISETIETHEPKNAGHPDPYTREFLQGRTVDILRSNIAATLGVRGRSRMAKAELIEAILEAQEG